MGADLWFNPPPPPPPLTLAEQVQRLETGHSALQAENRLLRQKLADRDAELKVLRESLKTLGITPPPFVSRTTP